MICAVILLVVFLGTIRLCTKPKKKITIEARTAVIDVDGKKTFKSMASQPPMDAQYVAEHLDMLELTKKNRREPIYDALSGNSNRGNSNRGSSRGNYQGDDLIDPAPVMEGLEG